MAVSAVASSSLCLSPPSFDGLRVLQQTAASVKAAPSLTKRSNKRSLIVAEGVDSTATSTTTPPAASSSKSSDVTIEYQRQRAKELQDYFADKKYEEETFKGRIFGWTRKNEITNGRSVCPKRVDYGVHTIPFVRKLLHPIFSCRGCENVTLNVLGHLDFQGSPERAIKLLSILRPRFRALHTRQPKTFIVALNLTKARVLGKEIELSSTENVVESALKFVSATGKPSASS
ncbi:hypothetical protein AXG93_1864s1100 [Marchantia polymorpha subsp. ruderalis]|uniref:Uncharacterized protein n=1 Tax=Marchantia polymorpha subsp. ruderalis TaxID=1480154 RepID=A0A176WR26_MARPO|nr:hypothetical protein AXG93_1864s1100 [Marchantia polymorpha subsp. ruderalis]